MSPVIRRNSPKTVDSQKKMTVFLTVCRPISGGHTVMNLTNTALRNAKARPNAYKLTDGNGL